MLKLIVLMAAVVALIALSYAIEVPDGQTDTVQPIVAVKPNKPLPAPVVPAEPIKLPAILRRIAGCESANEQFGKDGKVKKNPHSSAIGRFQIMYSLHHVQAEALGYDLYTEAGNTAFALWLYQHQGTQPWLASKNCWNN